MGDVVDITSRLPHVSGPCKCLSCGHEWIGVMPTGTISIQCPSCLLERGTYKYPVQPDQHWVCSCGNNLFLISAKMNGVCIGCGALQRMESC